MNYDPYEIRITSRQITVHEFLSRVYFQNTITSWSDRQKSSLIESILIRIPIQVFYVSDRAAQVPGNDLDLWTIVDGQKRLLALKEFCVDKTLRLQGLEYLTDLEGNSFDELKRLYQRRVEETMLTVHSIDVGTPLEVYQSICQRITQGF